MSPHATWLNRLGPAIWALCGLAAPLWTADAGGARVPAAPGQAMPFDIPAQPLDTALDRYADATGRPAVFRSALVAGRSSAPVQGSYTPEAALRLLLDGTGLVASDVDAGGIHAFVLEADPAAASAPLAAEAQNERLADYDGLLQAAVWEAFCGDPRTRPGDYRSLLRFQVDASGQVRQPRLLGSSGDARRDAALLEILGQVHVDQPPPPGLAQPLTMLVLPRGEIAGYACAAS